MDRKDLVPHLKLPGPYVMAACFRSSPDIKELPCLVVRYCPYGVLVEFFELEPAQGRCPVYGHKCPAFKVAEKINLKGVK